MNYGLELWILHGLFIVSAMVASITPVHMMQLSSYQTPGYIRWLRQSSGDVLMGYFPVALLAMTGLFQGSAVAWVGVGFLAVLMITCRPRKAKKPFKLTSRALRIFAAQFILLCGIAAFSWFFGHLMEGRVRYVTLAAGYIGVLVLVISANIICLPLQKIVNGHYIADARKRLRGQPDLSVIGITGSYGKTSTKTYLTQLLSVRYNVLMTPESYNTPMGIVRTIRERLEPVHRLFICEMGARHKGDIKENCDIVSPKHGMITSIGPQHLETFKTLDTVVSTKFELIDALPPDGIAFLAWDNEHIRTHKIDHRAVKYGLGEGCDYTAVDLTASASGSRFAVVTKDGERQEYATTLLGSHNVCNLVGAIAVAHTMGIPLCDMAQAVRAIKPASHRLEILPKGNGVTIIDDAYNANPSGVRAAIDALSMFDTLKVMVTPGMVELGEREAEENRSFGEYAAPVCDFVALVGEKHTIPIAEGLRAGGMEKKNIKVFANIKLALDWVYQIDRGEKEMVVLLENDLPDNY